MIAGDGHLRCHQDRKFGNFLLQLLVPSDVDGSGRKTCKLNKKYKGQKKEKEKTISKVALCGCISLFAHSPAGEVEKEAAPGFTSAGIFKMFLMVALQTYQNDSW